jgi:hypothetical protein
MSSPTGRQLRLGSVALAMILAAGCVGRVTPGGAGNSPAGTGTGSTAGPGNASGTGNAPGAGTGNANGSGNAPGAGSGGAHGGGAVACTPGVAITSQVPRLTNVQYERTVYDLLGVTTLKAAQNAGAAGLLATDQSGGLTELAWSSYKTVADLIATQVMGDADLKKNFLKCTPTGDGKACLHDTIVQFGRRAFRRPLTTDEVARFDALVTNGASLTATGTTDEIAGMLLYMFLIHPSFLQRLEISGTADPTGRYPLSSHEVASRLSYMLWGSVPDDLLSAAADQNQLTTPAQILAQAQRMIASDKARSMISDFHRYYLLMGTNTRWDSANHDPTLFPVFKKTIVPSLVTETERFFDNVVFGRRGTFQDLLTSPVAFVNADLAPLYGLDASQFGADLKEVALDPMQRPGFLTRLGFLNAYSFFNRTSPILRGAFITKQILGTPIDAPPPGAEATALPPASADLNTNRKQVDAQTAGANCQSCHHGFINPPGFVMEAYDAVGRWQTVEAATKVPLDLTVDIAMDGQLVHVTTPAELMAKIAASPMAQRRYAEKWVSYAFEREGDPLDCGTVNDLATKMTAGGYTVLNLITDLTQTPQFRGRAVGALQ